MVSLKMLFPVATSNCLITGMCHNYCPAVVKMFKKIIEKIAGPNWAKRKITYQAVFDFNLLSTKIRETESFLLFKKKLERMP